MSVSEDIHVPEYIIDHTPYSYSVTLVYDLSTITMIRSRRVTTTATMYVNLEVVN